MKSLGLIFVAIFLSPTITLGQQSTAGTKVVQVTGLVGVKANASGRLTAQNGKLEFADAHTKTSVPIQSIEDVTTGNDSQRVFRGTVGTLTQFAPYGGGRFLSLFRSKLDTLTVKYRDSEGGLHGAIFTMPVGQADPLKKELVAQGAHTSIPVLGDSTSASTPEALKEKKP